MSTATDRPADVLDSRDAAPDEAVVPAGPPAPQRDRYIDSLRVVALVRVMTYHAFGWAWLPLLFPSMGIMFALAGTLVAASLDRSPGNPWRVLRKRVVRLLPPVWLLGAVLVPVMLVAGWTWSEAAGSPLHVRTLLLWLLPVSDPPGSAFGEDWVLPLWYVRTYLWFLILSPMALWLFRHWPKRMLALPAGVVGLWTVGALPLDGRTGDVVLSLATFGGCWLLGFAHHDGRIRRLPVAPVLAGGAALMALGVGYAVTHPDPATGWDIDNIPLADMLYCLGAVLVLLRLYPDFSWMARHRVLDTFVVVNSRAMTIYLWGNVAIFLSHPVLDLWSVTAALDQDTWFGALQAYVAAWLVLGVCVLAFGWCEDLAARRRVRFNPWPVGPGRLSALRTLRPFTVPGGARLPRLTPRRLVLATTGLVVGAAVLAALALAGTRTPARTVAGDVQSRDALRPRPEVTRSAAPVPGPVVTLTPTPVPGSGGVVVPRGPGPDGGAGAVTGVVPGTGGPAGAVGGGALPRPVPASPTPVRPAPTSTPAAPPSSAPPSSASPTPPPTSPPSSPSGQPPDPTPDPTPTGADPSTPAAEPGAGPGGGPGASPTGGLVGTVGDVVDGVLGPVLP